MYFLYKLVPTYIVSLNPHMLINMVFVFTVFLTDSVRFFFKISTAQIISQALFQNAIE